MKKSAPKQQPKWKNSVAKTVLTNEILEGNIGNQTTSELYHSNEEFQRFTRRNFCSNFSNLQRKLETNEENAIIDAELIKHDRKLHPRGENTVAGYPFWDTSAARLLLESDKTTKTNIKPKDLWMSRPEYQEFPLTVFRCHVHDIKRKSKANAYWEQKQKAKKKK